jgi:hypothetical protein
MDTSSPASKQGLFRISTAGPSHSCLFFKRIGTLVDASSTSKLGMHGLTQSADKYMKCVYSFKAKFYLIALASAKHGIPLLRATQAR